MGSLGVCLISGLLCGALGVEAFHGAGGWTFGVVPFEMVEGRGGEERESLCRLSAVGWWKEPGSCR